MSWRRRTDVERAEASGIWFIGSFVVGLVFFFFLFLFCGLVATSLLRIGRPPLLLPCCSIILSPVFALPSAMYVRRLLRWRS